MESSTNFLIWGLTLSTKFTRCLLVGTVPDGKMQTLVPSWEMWLSYLVFFAGGKSQWLFRTIGSGTAIFKFWWTSSKLLFLKLGVSNKVFNFTIVSGKPCITNSSACFITLSLYSCTWNHELKKTIHSFSANNLSTRSSFSEIFQRCNKAFHGWRHAFITWRKTKLPKMSRFKKHERNTLSVIRFYVMKNQKLTHLKWVCHFHKIVIFDERENLLEMKN